MLDLDKLLDLYLVLINFTVIGLWYGKVLGRTLGYMVGLQLDEQLDLGEAVMVIIYLAWGIRKWLVFYWLSCGT